MDDLIVIKSATCGSVIAIHTCEEKAKQTLAMLSAAGVKIAVEYQNRWQRSVTIGRCL